MAANKSAITWPPQSPDICSSHSWPKLDDPRRFGAGDRATAVGTVNGSRAGEEKAEALATVLEERGKEEVPSLPAALISPLTGNLTFLVDRDAAARLEGGGA